MAALAIGCTLAIGFVYDRLWGPDPARFSFGANFAMEFVGVAIHVAAATIVLGIAGRGQASGASASGREASTASHARVPTA